MQISFVKQCDEKKGNRDFALNPRRAKNSEGLSQFTWQKA